MSRIKEKIQISVPFKMLRDRYLDLFIRQGLNPEIGLDASSLDELDPGEAAGISSRLERHGLRVTLHGPFFDLSPGSLDREILKVTWMRLEQTVRAVSIFKAENIVFHAGYDEKRYGFEKAEWIKRSIGTWSRLCGLLKGQGCRLMLENVYEHDPREIRMVLESLDRNDTGFCFDTGHQRAFSGISDRTWLESLGAYLDKVHLHDNFGVKDEHLAPGKGVIDFKGLFLGMRETRDAPPDVTLEPHKEEDLWPGLEYLEKIWPW